MSLRRTIAQDVGDWRLLPEREQRQLLVDPDTPRSVVEDMSRNGSTALRGWAEQVLKAPEGSWFSFNEASKVLIICQTVGTSKHPHWTVDVEVR